MNVVILTPDGVGSTLLQRALTIQMILSNFDKPVINLHELTNGISTYYSHELQAMVLGKNFSIRYAQSLPKIIELLSTHDHYKTSRLAHYHILRRNDSFEDQKQFYDYLNENFFIISARRKNLLDYALSWCLRNIHKKLNVYSSEEKILSFFEMYKDPVTVDTEILVEHLEDYKKYIVWAEQHFDVGSNYYYETHLPNLENYILNLPIFTGREKKEWQDSFNISFENFNKCHKSFSDIGSIALEKSNDVKLLTFEKSEENQELESKIISHLPVSTQLFVAEHEHNYRKAQKSIQHMVNLGLMVTGLPIKKHTFAEKKFLIKNFDECIFVYNNWIDSNSKFGEPIDNNFLQLGLDKDSAMWSIKE
jgi:hypothetical protein